MERDLERFEQIFTYKKKSLEEFIGLMWERAELEENYAKSIEKLSTNLSVFAEKSPLASVLNSLKSYHAMRSEQSQTLATSLKEEVVLVLKAMLKKESEETKKTLSNGKKNDQEMKGILERIENTRKKYITLNTDIEELQKTQAFLQNMEANNDSQFEEKRLATTEKLSRLVNSRGDCDKDLKKNIDDYNDFKKTFIESCNSVIEYFKTFDTNRLNSFRDSTMKYFVFEISYFRNIQYDVTKVIQNVENAEFSKEIEESVLYRPKQEPSPMDFEKFKEMFVNAVALEEKNRGSILFEKTQIPENLGLSTAFKSIVGLFSNPKSTDSKKKEEEKRLIEKQWEFLSKGQPITEENELRFSKLLAHNYNRKIFIDLFTEVKISLSPEQIPSDQFEKVRDTILQIFQLFLVEAWQNKGFESLKFYFSAINKFTKDLSAQEKENNIYCYVDENLSSMAMFKNEARWKEFLLKSIVMATQKSEHDDHVVHIGKIRKDIVLMRHLFVHEDMDKFISSTALEGGLNQEGVDKLLAENYVEVDRSRDSVSEKGNNEQIGQEKNEHLGDWIEKMEQKIQQAEKSKRTGASIFSGRPLSSPASPTKQQRTALQSKNGLLNQAINRNFYQKAQDKAKKRIFETSFQGFSTLNEDQNKKNEPENSYISISTDTTQ